TTRQARVQEFVRDCFRLKAEIIAEHFTREKLSEMTGIDLPMQAEIDQARQQLQMFAQAAQQPQQPQLPPPGAQGMAPQLPAPQMPQPDPETLKELQSIAKSVSWEE